MKSAANTVLSRPLKLLAGCWLFLAGCTSAPEGGAGKEAEELAQRIAASVNLEAWNRTGIVSWRFADKNDHLWDRVRKIVRVSWDDSVVYFHQDTRQGVARRGEAPLRGLELKNAVEEAYAKWINDAFWLNPIPKFFDDGVVRSLVREDGEELLLVSYQTGGLTPGDKYLWEAGSERPTAWRMWTSNVPIKGLKATWAGWKKLETDAWVATEHKIGLITLELTEVHAARHWSVLFEVDPFARLLEK